MKLNKEEAGTTENTSALSDKLKTIFEEREKNGVFKPGKNEIEKSVYLAADRSAAFEEIAKLYSVLKDSGASPILIPVSVAEQNNFPNPLLLIVYAGSGESRSPEAGIEIEFFREYSEDDSIIVLRDGSFRMNDKKFSKDDLKMEIEKILKSKGKNGKTINVGAENYGDMEDIAKIAAAAGAEKVHFITK